MGVEHDYFRHSQSASSTMGLTMSPWIWTLPAKEGGGVLRLVFSPLSCGAESLAFAGLVCSSPFGGLRKREA
jgi:hypothetical protein